MTDEFAVGVAEVAGRLSLLQVRAWCAVLEQASGPHPSVEADLLVTGPIGGVGRLMSLWREATGLPGAAVALALRAAAQVHENAEIRRPRLVVTGPATPAVPVRLTSSVVIDIVRAAAERVLLVSFAAHGVTEVVRELGAAADRGVAVDLVLETTQDHGGRLQPGAGSGAFDALADRATFWHWPIANRRHSRAALHAKVLVVDGKVAMLTSANFTDRGFGDNIEIGLLLRDPALASPLDRHFRSLMRPDSACLVPLAAPS